VSGTATLTSGTLVEQSWRVLIILTPLVQKGIELVLSYTQQALPGILISEAADVYIAFFKFHMLDEHHFHLHTIDYTRLTPFTRNNQSLSHFGKILDKAVLGTDLAAVYQSGLRGLSTHLQDPMRL
jgi:hypothetical protein